MMWIRRLIDRLLLPHEIYHTTCPYCGLEKDMRGWGTDTDDGDELRP